MKKIVIHYQIPLDNSTLEEVVETMTAYGSVDNLPELPEKLLGSYEIETADDIQTFVDMMNELDSRAGSWSPNVEIVDFEVVDGIDASMIESRPIRL